MRRVLVLIGIVGAAYTGGVGTQRSSASPSLAFASCSGAASWQQARRAVGRVATIRGYVASTKYASYSNGSPTFLDIGAAYPSASRVSVVIWRENRAKFGRPEVRYLRRTICVRGYVSTYGGVPQIEATSPTQIAIAG
jgi:hypothetical protein